MKKLTFANRCITSMLIVLTVCNPISQASAALPPTYQVAEPSVSNGKLANGLSYTIVNSGSETQDEVMVRLSVRTNNISDSPEDQGKALLTQQSLFFGTQKYKRERIIQLLSSLDFDIDGDSHFKSNGKEAAIQFALSADRQGELYGLLSFLKEISQNATLSDDAVEMARQHALANLKAKLDSTQKEQATQQITMLAEVESLTAAEIRDYYAKWYRPDLMHLVISGNITTDNVEQYIQEGFESQALPASQEKDVAQAQKDHGRFQTSLLALSNAETIDQTKAVQGERPIKEISTAPVKIDGEQVTVIDGKIWMKDPNWINKSSNGWNLSIGLAAAAIFLAPFTAGTSLILLGIPAVYFYTAPYLKDPEYVQEKRKEDLRLGFERAYEKNRAHITLTPFERRQMFITETLKRQVGMNNYRNSGIALLADTYDLSDNTFTPMFYTDEITTLAQIKKDFTRERNQWKAARVALENELLGLTRPYREDRDYQLEEERIAFETSYYVSTRAAWKQARDEAIDAIEESRDLGEISYDDAKFAIKEEERKFDVAVADPGFSIGYQAAKDYYNVRQMEINGIYDYNVSVIKQQIQYDARMVYFIDGEKSLYDYYDNQYMQVLAQFTIVDYGVADWVDLRNQ